MNIALVGYRGSGKSAVARALAEQLGWDWADADAVLEGTVHRIEYTPLRSTRLDTLRPEELQNTVILNWKLTDARDRSKVLASGSSTGTSRFFVDSNLQTSRNNALPDALQRASESMISRLANGF